MDSNFLSLEFSSDSPILVLLWLLVLNTSFMVWSFLIVLRIILGDKLPRPQLSSFHHYSRQKYHFEECQNNRVASHYMCVVLFELKKWSGVD